MMGETYALVSRELKRFYRQRFAIVFTIITPLFWLALFGKSLNLGGLFSVAPGTLSQLAELLDVPLSQLSEAFSLVFESITKSLFGTTDYFTFMASGMLSILILFTSMWSGMSIVWDRRFGFLNKLLVSPIPTSSIVLSKVFSTVIRGMVQAVLVFSVAMFLGLRVAEGFGPLNLLGIFAALALLSIGLSSLFVATAFTVTSHETLVALANMVNLPLMFASNALFPLEQMPDWLQIIAKFNPITYAVSAVRGFVLMNVDWTQLLNDLTVLAAFALAFSAMGILISHRILKR